MWGGVVVLFIYYSRNQRAGKYPRSLSLRPAAYRFLTDNKTMLWYYAPTLLMLLQSVICVPNRGKATDKPETMATRHRKPTHISEFTDPNTGLNPFLDLEEGRTSVGRNVMEEEDDERRNDEPYFGLDPVEGDSSDRRWNLEEPKENFGRHPPSRWSELDIKDEDDFVVSTTPLIPPNPPTTVELFVTKDLEHDDKSGSSSRDEETQLKVKKEEKELFTAISQRTVIYASASIAALTAVVLLAGALFWWRKKQKTTSQPPTATTVESGEVKS